MGITLGNPNQSYSENGEIDQILTGLKNDQKDLETDWKAMKDADGLTNTFNAANKVQDDTLGKANRTISSIDKTIDRNTINGNSIIARSRNSVLQFPVYMTQSIRVSEAAIIAKLFERVYASYVQAALAQNPIVDESEVNNLLFLRKFHTNINESKEFELYNEYYTPVDNVDSIMKESEYHVEQVTPTMDVVFRFIPTKDQNIIRESKRLVNEPLKGLGYLKEDTVIDTKTTSTSGSDSRTSMTRLSAREIEEIGVDQAHLTQAEKDVYGKSDKEIADAARVKFPDKSTESSDNEERDKYIKSRIQERDNAKHKVDDAIKNWKQDVKDGKKPGYVYSNGNYMMGGKTTSKSTNTQTSTVTRTTTIEAPKLLRDADIKKLNDMLPYTIEATFRVRNKENNVAYDAHFIIGVKTVMHLIRVDDIKDDLRGLVTGNIKSLQKVRYKTGEIKFSDYLFDFKGLKADAAKRVDSNKRWISSLKRLADWNKLHGTALKKVNDETFNGKVPIPNGTMILSQSDVATLTASTGIDISSVSNAKRLAKSLFLIAVAIVDPSAGSMKVLFPDTDNDWDIQSLANIDRELAKTDNSQLMKELNRMVNK